MAYNTFIGYSDVTIYDKFGNEFYKYFPKKTPFFFNISLKHFTVDGEVFYSDKKLVYKVALPIAKVDMPEITIEYTNGDNKGSLNRQTGILTIDEKYRTQPFFMLAFIYFHEMGHFLFPTPKSYAKAKMRHKKTEFRCDKFAAKMMLKRGYNPSQILAAMKFVLGEGEEQSYRYDKMINFLNSIKTKLI